MSHTITITRLPDDENDDAEYAIDGPCDSDCRVWRECPRATCQRMSSEYPPFEERYRHGVEHKRIDGVWMVDMNECGLDHAYHLNLAADEMGELGTYALQVDWDGDEWCALIGDKITERLGDPYVYD